MLHSEAGEDRGNLPKGGVLKNLESLCRCVPHQEMPVATIQAWGFVCAGDNTQVECVAPCAQRGRDMSYSSAALRASHRFPPLKIPRTRYGVHWVRPHAELGHH